MGKEVCKILLIPVLIAVIGFSSQKCLAESVDYLILMGSNGSTVIDDFLLTNTTNTASNALLYYSFTGAPSDFQVVPTIFKTNGGSIVQQIEWDTYPGDAVLNSGTKLYLQLVKSGNAIPLYSAGTSVSGSAFTVLWSGVTSTTSMGITAGTITAAPHTFSTVPIPGAVWLLGSGLIGLAGLKRRFHRRQILR